MHTPSAIDRDFLVIENVVKTYTTTRGNRIRAVDGASLTIARGEVVGLVGESGCGKSSIAKLIVGLEHPESGSIRIAGIERRGLSGAPLRAMRRRVQLIFQDPFAALDPRMRLEESLNAPLAAHRMGTTAERRLRVVKMLDAVGLDDGFLRRLPRECSGGQLQRVVIARALLLEPDLLVCDEPTSALDASVRAQILNLLVSLQKQFSLAILMISHDLRVIRFIADRVAVMYLGQIVEAAPSDSLFDAPHHPYTRALIAASMIDKSGLHDPAAQLKGEPPSQTLPPSGCRFHPRCKMADDFCAQVAPALEGIARERLVRCHHWRDGDHASISQIGSSGSA